MVVCFLLLVFIFETQSLSQLLKTGKLSIKQDTLSSLWAFLLFTVGGSTMNSSHSLLEFLVVAIGILSIIKTLLDIALENLNVFTPLALTRNGIQQQMNYPL